METKETNYSMDAFATLNGTANMLKKQKDTVKNNPFILDVQNGQHGIGVNVCTTGKDFDNLVISVFNAYVKLLKDSNKSDDYITYKMSNVCATAARMNNVTPTPACNGRINKYALDDFLDNAPDEVKDELKDVVEELAEMLSGGEE